MNPLVDPDVHAEDLALLDEATLKAHDRALLLAVHEGTPHAAQLRGLMRDWRRELADMIHLVGADPMNRGQHVWHADRARRMLRMALELHEADRASDLEAANRLLWMILMMLSP